MELIAREDVEAPIERVFADMSNFDAIQRRALRRGALVERKDSLTEPGKGMTWEATVTFRGKERGLTIAMTEYAPPERMSFHSISGGLEADTTFELVALSKTSTRITMTTVLVPKTLSARLLVQSLKLGKTQLDKKFRKRMAGLATELENRLKNTA
ncbi:SRPBCC family protein [Thetidibacter halocola]|uniref:SRPBCC family protein n=1 Tax=Thetidibacter halocola TaxID=2827239 RepID=A0A8J7WD87_9RHOB|nr:SRPBCC family protein [Thetidibacter halocola]MBS0125450.1 SRPBCC family protein [Thetidibacter halocola]